MCHLSPTAALNNRPEKLAKLWAENNIDIDGRDIIRASSMRWATI